MKVFLLLLCAVVLALLRSACAQDAPSPQATHSDAEALLRQIDAIRSPSENFVFTVQLQAQTGSGSTANEFEVAVRNSTQSLVQYRQPIKQRGRALLLDGPNMWIYIPGTSRPVRISPQQQLIGAVSNADVARVVFNLDYEAERVEKARLGDTPVLRLTLRARQATTSYQSVILRVADPGLRPLTAEFYSLSGKLIRTIRYEGYQQVLGVARPTVLNIADAINPAVTATLTYSNFRIKETPEAYFQPSYLGRLAN